LRQRNGSSGTGWTWLIVVDAAASIGRRGPQLFRPKHPGLCVSSSTTKIAVLAQNLLWLIASDPAKSQVVVGDLRDRLRQPAGMIVAQRHD
jgi:hypothetical protein